MTRERRNVTLLVAATLIGALLVTRDLWRPVRCFDGPPPPATITRVVDGDTVRVMFYGKNESVRLLRIDTPERGGPGYDEATAALKELLDGGQVRLEFETPGKVERDKFDQLLCYVFLPDGRCANVGLVRLGHSKFWTRYGRGRLAEQFEAGEQEAR